MSVAWRGTREELKDAIRSFAAALAGSPRAPSDQRAAAEQVLLAIGFAALSDIHDAYITKSRGGTDAMGYTWQPLAPSTIARRLVRLQRMPQSIRSRPGYQQRLDAERQEKRRIRQQFRGEINEYNQQMRSQESEMAARYAAGMPRGEARALARRIIKAEIDRFAAEVKRRQRRMNIDRVAKSRVSRSSGMTRDEWLASLAEVEILRDTGRMLNSLSPGILAGESYMKPTSDGGAEQVMDTAPGSVTVGTNVAYALYHQEGTARMPARPFFPKDAADVPDQWWSNWADAGTQAMQGALEKILL